MKITQIWRNRHIYFDDFFPLKIHGGIFGGYIMFHNIKAVIWDLDNTITDSRNGHFKAWDNTLKRYGIPHDLDFFERHYGMSNREVFETSLVEYVKPEDIDSISDEKEEKFRRIIESEPVAMLPGVLDWLQFFGDKNIIQGLASSSPMVNIVAQIQSIGIGDFFHIITTGAPLLNGKPHPQIFLNTALGLGIPASQCLVMEDTLHGIEAALRSDMYCILVRDMNGDDEMKILETLGSQHAKRAQQYICVSSLEGLQADSFLI